MRDRYMHGEGHSYPILLPHSFMQEIVEDVAYVKATLPIFKSLLEDVEQ